VFWEDTRQPVERGSECRATHTYTLATALTPLPQWRGLPRKSPLEVLQCLRACRLGYEPEPLSATSWGDGRESAAGGAPGTPVGCPGRGGPTCVVEYHGTYWYVPWYVRTYHGTVRVRIRVLPWYHGTIGTRVRTKTTMVHGYQWYHGTVSPLHLSAFISSRF
jgi:hypothetical protein